MRKIYRIIPVIISFILLGAHFLRAGNGAGVAATLLVPFLLFIKKRWSLVMVQIVTYIGAGVWIYTGFRIYQIRVMMGAPWGRMAVVLGLVAIFTVFAGLFLNAASIKEHYPASGNRGQSALP